MSADFPTPTSIRVIATVARRDDRLLVCQRPPHKRHGGLWEFPGGKTDPGESDEDAARRERDEELGVRLVRADPVEVEFEDPSSHFLIAFVPVEFEGEPTCHEHTGFVWGTPAELAAPALAPSARRYAEHLLSREEHIER